MLHLHRAERADRLVDALAAVLARPLPDPFQPEVVAVHSRGIERWLAQELSGRLGAGAGRGDGVCANVEFPFPSRVVGRTLAAATGTDPDDDPWAPERLVWPLLDVVEAHLDDERLAPVRAHLHGDGEEAQAPRSGRRFGAVRHVADLFDRYAVHRPGMLRRWADGEDVDAGGDPVDDDLAWQPHLWRLVRAAVGVRGPAERIEEATARLRDGVELPDVPERLSLFGLTALPASYLAVLEALAQTRDVHLLLLHPSPALWEAVAERLPDTRPVRRDDDPTRRAAGNPLLASWGRDARELQVVVSAAAATDEHLPLDAPQPTTLLSRLQAAVRADLPPPRPDDRPLLDPADRSVQVHACHGRARQVEVLRDAILHLLADDPTLEPRDVIVMCPDIEAFAPLVHAVFGAHVEAAADGTGTASGLPDLRVRLADRSIRETNPVLRVVAELLALADGRLTASEVLGLASREPVRRRFRFDDDDLERLAGWVADARIRWGLDGDHRAAFDLAGVEANTWRAGLDRVLLGVTMADEGERLVGGATPLDDVEGGDVDVAGRFAEFVDRLGAALADLAAPRPVAGWCASLRSATDALTATADHVRWQGLQLHRLLADVEDAARVGGEPSDVAITLPELRALLEDRLRGRPSRANHRTGDLTVCTLVPMRSVPHRVVCLLGMDDGAFPRRTAPDGDDLTDRAEEVGDRDPRTEDRQLLLDALLAAADHLVVTYTGRDERTNEPRPPAVPVGELVDAVDRSVVLGDPSRPASSAVVVDHPLQPSDPANFREGTLLPGRRWGFDRTALAGAVVKARGVEDDPPFLAAPLPAEEVATVDLDDLVRFLEHPTRSFLRRRLGVSLPAAAEESSDAIPVELDALERWSLGDRLLSAQLSGVDVDRWLAAERARGNLPPGDLAAPVVEEVRDTVAALLAAAREHATVDGSTGAVEVDVALPDGPSVLGTVGDVAGDVVLALRYSRVAPKHRLGAWARLLAASAAHPERPLSAVTVGRYGGDRSGLAVTVCRVPPLGATPDERRRAALGGLGVLVDLFLRGSRAPLPLACATSAAYAAAVVDGEDPEDAAEAAWATAGRLPKEDHDPEHRLALGGVVPISSLLAEPPWEDEAGWPDAPHRFGRVARRLWDPLLAVEEVTDL